MKKNEQREFFETRSEKRPSLKETTKENVVAFEKKSHPKEEMDENTEMRREIKKELKDLGL